MAAAQLDDIWEQAAAHYRHHLSDRDRKRIKTITSPQELQELTQTLRKEYGDHRVAGALEKTQVFVDQLRSFTRTITIFAQTDKIASLVWGSLALIVELGARHQERLETISDFLEQIQHTLPRFAEYIQEFGPTERLKGVFVTYYAELLAHYQDAIDFLTTSSLKNVLLFSQAATRYHDSAKKRLETLREKKTWVEQEISWQKYQAQKKCLQSLDRQLVRADNMAPAAATMSSFTTPYPRNRRFHFREDELQQLQSRLRPGADASGGLRTASLHGLSGVGKTQIALEFAHRSVRDYEAIFWFDADTEANLRESLYRNARTIDMEAFRDTLAQDDTALAAAFQGWLRTATRDGRPLKWLLIFDDVWEENVLDQLWPAGACGSIMLTTRRVDISEARGDLAIQVPLFTAAESSNFMRHLNPAGPAVDDDRELQTAREIADRLGYLPLSLGHVASHARSTGQSYQCFLRRYQDLGAKLLFRLDSFGGPSALTLSDVWTMRMAAMDQATRFFIETLAMFDHGGVPLDIFTCRDRRAKMYNGPETWIPNLHESLRCMLPDQQTADRVISTLFRGSLIDRRTDGDRVSWHQMGRELVLQSLSRTPESLAARFDWAVFALNACFPTTPHGSPLLHDWDRCAMLHPHISALLDVYKRFSNTLRPAVLLCDIVRRCSWYHVECRNFKDATDLLTQACSILEGVSVDNAVPGYSTRYITRLTADMYAMFGGIESETNDMPGARTWFEKAKHHRMETPQCDRDRIDMESMAVLEANTAITYLADGVADAAITSCQRLLDTFDLGPSRGQWAANLSVAYRIGNQLDESLQWCKQSYNLTLDAYGEQSLCMAAVHFNTACTLLLMDQDDKAIPHLIDCLKIRLAKSPRHPYTAFTCHKLSSVMRLRRDYELAVSFLRHAIGILQPYESHKGAAARSKVALAETLEKMGGGPSDETRALRREAIRSLEGLMDDKPAAAILQGTRESGDDAEAARRKLELATLMEDMGDTAVAEPLRRLALRTLESRDDQRAGELTERDFDQFVLYEHR